MLYSHFNLVVFIIYSFILRQFDAEAAVDPIKQIIDYDNKVCTNEPTCNLTTTIPNLRQNKLRFPWRDCMCDADCSEYGDCCQDSLHNKKPTHDTPSKTYYCSPEAKIYMLVSCLPDFADERIKANCAKALKPLESNNFALILPVTNIAKRVTYANPYCALCNKDHDFVQWNYVSGCGEPSKEALERRRLEVKKESSITQSGENSTLASASTPVSTTTATSTTTSEANNHSHPDNIHVDLNLDTANKTIDSETGLLGVKTTGRRKRASNLGSINYYMYARKVNEIFQDIKYDPSVKELVAEYDNKTLVCRLGSRISNTVTQAVRHCVPNLISACPHNEAANKVCQSYMSFVKDGSTRKSYRNVDCAKCNGFNPMNKVGQRCIFPLILEGPSLFLTQVANANNEGCNDPALKQLISC